MAGSLKRPSFYCLIHFYKKADRSCGGFGQKLACAKFFLDKNPLLWSFWTEMASTDFASVGAAVSAGKPLIVDVRTEDEFAAGRIPGAVNIPLSEVEFAFSLPEKKFTETFGIGKPGMADLIITSCKVGGRAAKMRDTGVQAYQGSFAEWESRGGLVEK